MVRAAALILALVLVGCSDRQTADDRICVTPWTAEAWLKETKAFNEAPPTDPVTRKVQQERITEQCIHRWAYRLSRSKESTTLVAAAAVQACEDAVIRLAGDEAIVSETPYFEARESTFAEMDRVARLSTIQARAGNCDIN